MSVKMNRFDFTKYFNYDVEGYIINRRDRSYMKATYGDFVRMAEILRKQNYQLTYEYGGQDGPQTKTWDYVDKFVILKMYKDDVKVGEYWFYTVHGYEYNTEKKLYVRPNRTNGRGWKDFMDLGYKPAKITYLSTQQMLFGKDGVMKKPKKEWRF